MNRSEDSRSRIWAAFASCARPKQLKSSMSILDTRVLLLSLPSWDAAPRTKGLQKAGRGTIELVEELRSATEHGTVRAAP